MYDMYVNLLIDSYVLADASIEDKLRNAQQTAMIYKMCAVVMLQPELRKRIEDELKEMEINIDFDRAMQNVYGEHRRMLYKASSERIEAAHPSTRDFSLEGLPEDTKVDMVNHFDNWVIKNKYDLDKAFG